MEYKDIAGRAITVGAIVCYAALWDRSATLRYGKVTALKSRPAQRWMPEGPVALTLRLTAVDRDHDGVWHIINNGNAITLSFLDRLLVVPDILVPVSALRLLKASKKTAA